MSKLYFKKLCRDTNFILQSQLPIKIKLAKAFAEMGIARPKDTSIEIWKKFLLLRSRYVTVTNEISNLLEEGYEIGNYDSVLFEFKNELTKLVLEGSEYAQSEIRKHNSNK